MPPIAHGFESHGFEYHLAVPIGLEQSKSIFSCQFIVNILLIDIEILMIGKSHNILSCDD